jgi:amidophosphoribosyltransferase
MSDSPLTPPDLFSEGPHDECGVFGIYAPGRQVAQLTYFALFALQHRGQEGAGIVSCDGQRVYEHRGLGLVSQVFNDRNMEPLIGHMAVGHNRYSTTGSNHLRNVQPHLIETMHGPLAVAHNGNLTNATGLRHTLLQHGGGLSSTNDTEVMVQALARLPDIWQEKLPPEFDFEDEDPWRLRIRAFMEVAEGAYSLAILTRDALYAVRDPLGLRPLCLGQLEGGGWVVASESCALQTIGAELVREIEPGEIMRIDGNGIQTTQGKSAERRALCIFEYVYFARPDSRFEGQLIHQVRQRMGWQLAREAPVSADLIVAVPDSATPACIGYSQESGIPFSEGLTKNRYIGRTFIQPDDQLRRDSVKLKYNVLDGNLRGKRVVLIDDSIVRGNTIGPIVRLLREGGAAEVHVRVTSPPVRHPCFMGVDMATRGQLIAHRMDNEAICRHIGADSLHYLSLAGMHAAVRPDIGPVNGDGSHTGHCNACFSGKYPISIPAWLFDEDREKVMFEGVLG